MEAWHRTILRRRWRRSNRHSHFEDEKHRRIVDLDVVGLEAPRGDSPKPGAWVSVCRHAMPEPGEQTIFTELPAANHMERRIFYIVVLRRWVARRPPLCPRTAKWPPLLGAGL